MCLMFFIVQIAQQASLVTPSRDEGNGARRAPRVLFLGKSVIEDNHGVRLIVLASPSIMIIEMIQSRLTGMVGFTIIDYHRTDVLCIHSVGV